MVTSTESGSGRVDSIVQEAKDSINREISAVTTEEQKQALADKLKNELNDADTKAKQAAKDTKKIEAEKQEIKKKQALSLVRMLEASKHEDIPVLKDKQKTKKILEELSKKIEGKSLSNSTLASIEEGLKDYILGDKDIVISKSGEEKTQFEKDFDKLKQTDKRAAEVVGKALIDQRGQFNAEEADMKQKFDINQDQIPASISPENGDQAQFADENNGRRYNSQEDIDRLMQNEQYLNSRSLHNALREVDSVYASYAENYYNPRLPSLEHRNMMAALHNPYAFIRYVKEKRNEIIQKKSWKDRTLSNEEEKTVQEDVSKEIRNTVSDIINRFFVQLARERPTKTFEEITREDFYHGIAITVTTFKTALSNLSSRLENIEQKHPELIPSWMKMYKETEKAVESEEVQLGEGKDKIMKPRLRIKPLPVPSEVNLSAFIKNSIELLVSEKSHIREYLHDGRSIYYHPAGKDGFYAGLQGYAERMQTGDIDTLFNLPDGQIIKDAYQLYSKFLFEQFAKQDWKHEPNQFINELESRYTAMEREVLDMLKKLHPELVNEPDRLENALYMGVGLSRAVFLNEPEMAAYADAPLSEEGKGVGASYYTNDTAALNAMNPMHWFMRWQGEQQIYPFLFAPIEGVHDLMKHGWDHNKLLNLGKEYFDSYSKGRKNLSGRTLFIDELVNMGHIGGPGTRRGWRTMFANEGHFIFKTIKVNGKEVQTNKLDALRTWKALENIGYEVVYDMVINNRLPGELMSAKDSIWSQERTEFFSYLFTKYFNQSPEALVNYLANIRSGVQGSVLKKLRNGEISPESISEAVETEVSGIFMHRVLARLLAQRLPTRILQDDRDRFADKGTSRYKEIRLELGWDIDTFDKIMKKLGLAEQKLRSEVSGEIKNILASHNATDLQNIDMSNIRYVLDEARLRKLLGGMGLDESEINQSAELLKKIQDRYTGNDIFLDKYAAERQKNAFPFSLAIDEIDWSLMAFRGTGARMIARAVGDIGLIERNLWMNCLRQLKDALIEVSTDGKHDISPLIKILQGVKEAYGDVHGHNPQSYANIHRLAAGMIAYFKKDAMSKGLLNILRPWRFGKPSSIAAEMAGGRSGAVWEWDAVDIDNFIVALETKRLLPRDQYDPSVAVDFDPVWVSFGGRMIKLPEKLKLPFKIFGKDEVNLFRKRRKNYSVAFSDKLRKEHGAKWYNLVFDFAAKYGPLFMAFILWKLLKDAIDEAQGKKKK